MKIRVFISLLAGLGLVIVWNQCALPQSIQVLSSHSQDPGFADGASLFKCNPELDPAPSIMRRLSRRELKNTLDDLFAGIVNPAEYEAGLLGYVSEFNNDKPVVKLFDSVTQKVINGDLVHAHLQIAKTVAEAATKTDAKLNQLDSCLAAAVNDSCLNSFITRFGRKIFRRPLLTSEQVNFNTLFKSGTSKAEGAERVLLAMLLSPNFIYQVEGAGSAVNGKTNLYRLTGFEIATRLSYLVLGTTPDETLLNAAANGEFNTAEGIRRQVELIFQHPRARDGIRHFYSQWLRLDYVPELSIPSDLAGGINTADFRRETIQEVTDFMDYLIWDRKGTYQDLMTSNLVFAKGPNLAKIYGVAQSNKAIAVPGETRNGILTRAGILMLSPAGHTAPILRGVRARVHLLCDDLGSPPNDTGGNMSEIDPLSSTRTQVAVRTSSPKCMLCHNAINPLGFAFEDYDGLGRYRTREVIYNSSHQAVRELDIDARVEPAISSFSEPTINGGAALGKAIAANPKGAQCLVRRYFEYAKGQAATGSDGCLLVNMSDSLDQNGLLETFKSYATGTHFTQRKVAP